jgi:hypothetical protein
MATDPVGRHEEVRKTIIARTWPTYVAGRRNRPVLFWSTNQALHEYPSDDSAFAGSCFRQIVL